MANDFFNVSGNPLDHTTGVSSVIRAEFAAIAAGFSALQVTPNLGAPTGTTATPGDSSTKLATTAFVAATAFSSALPGQSSNSGKFLTTNGTSASWVFIGGGATTHSGAVDVTLTDELTHIHPCNFSTNEKSVILPDATTLTVGCAYTFTQTGYFGFYVRDSTGRYINYVGEMDIVIATLVDKSTAAGVWVTTTISMPGQETGLEFFANAAASLQTIVIALTATTAIILYTNASGFICAQIATATGNDLAFGGVNVLNAINSLYVVGFSISSTSVLCMFKNVTTTFINAVVFTISGNTVTANTNYVLSATQWYNYSVTKLTATQGVFIACNTSFFAYAYTINIAGTVCTLGAGLALNALSSNAETTCCFLTTTKAVAAFYETATPKCQLVVVSVSGTTCSAGATFTSPQLLTKYWLCFIQTNYFCLAGSITGSGCFVSFFSVSGTTISADNTNNQISSNGTVTRCCAVLMDAANGLGNKIFISYQDVDSTLRGCFLFYVPSTKLNIHNTQGINFGACGYSNAAVLTVNKIISTCIESTFVAAQITETSAAI